VHLVLLAGALFDQLAPTRKLAPQRGRLVIGGPHLAGKPLANSRASAPASILSVFAAPDSCTALGYVSTTRATCGRNSRAIGNAFAVASSTTSAAGPRLSPNSVSASGAVVRSPSAW
jgi:hypothetical protein